MYVGVGGGGLGHGKALSRRRKAVRGRWGEGAVGKRDWQVGYRWVGGV